MILDDVSDEPFGTSVTLPDKSTISSIKKGNLPFTALSPKARETKIFKDLNHSLISLGQLCDDGCKVILTKQKLFAYKNNVKILEGNRSTSGDGLWDIPIITKNKKIQHNTTPSPHQEPSINIILRTNKKSTDLAMYHHGAVFSPTPDTFIKAIDNNFFLGWPGLTSSLIAKHLPPSTSTNAGHMRQERHSLRSTKSIPTTAAAANISAIDDHFPTFDPNYNKTHDVCYSLFATTDKAFMDLTGRFPYKSSRGNEYILIAYHYDSNAILGLPLKNRQAKTITTAWKSLQDKLIISGAAPSTWILDNETSHELQSAMTKYKTTFQFVPPHTHRANLAERAIQTFKGHFKAGLASVHPDFPISEWDRLLDQAFITLNLLRASRVNPKLSAYAYLFGNYDFNKNPLAPPGTKVMIHQKPEQRASWDPNSKLGWYIGPTMNHYRCLKCYLPQTKTEIDTDTISFIPHTIPIPETNIEDFIRQSISDIATLLTHPPKMTTPTLSLGDTTKNGLLQLTSLLHRSTTTSDIMNKQTKLALNAANKLHERSHPITPHISSPSRKITPSSPSSLQDAITQLTRVLHRAKLARVLHGHKQSRRRYHPSQYFQKQPNFNTSNIEISTLNHIYDDNGKKQTLEKLLNGPKPTRWRQALSNELGRLTQGNDAGVIHQDAMDFIFHNEIPNNAQVTYANFVCDYRPLKDEPWRVRLVVGGDKLTYEFDSGSPAASLLETKLLINSVISDAKNGAKFMSLDLKDFFLASPMGEAEYMRIPLKYLPEDIMIRYNLSEKIHQNYIYCKIKKGMYGLKQAAILAYNHLKQNLAPYGYEPIPHTDGLWRHKTRKITFCLCVDDFGIKYFNKQDVDHLISALQTNYKLSTDWSGANFCGLTFDWHYQEEYVDVSMPQYIPELLKKLSHTMPSKPQFSPFIITPYKPLKAGQRQYAPTPDESAFLNSTETTTIQQIVGSLLYYARAIDYTLLPALNTISQSQAKPTENTKKECQILLDYCATYPNVMLRYQASDMVLTIDSDAAYLVAPSAKSRVAGYFQLNSKRRSNPHTNAAILIECKTLRHVVASSAEAETAGVFHNAQRAIPIKYMLNQLGHPQPPTPIKMDNETATNFIHNNITQKKSKSWDMRYYWLRDQKNQNNFDFYWDRSENNHADYWTKHFTALYHRLIRATYVLDNKVNKVANMTIHTSNCKGVLVGDARDQFEMTSATG
jgi:hypothetical protein